jgi:DNA-binding beta-propeller fold protein YncE
MVAGVCAGVLAFAAGCGNQYRPVVTPVNPTGPAAQPAAYITLFSQPGFGPLQAGAVTPCAGTTYPTPSVITLVDFSGDSILDEAQGGNGPLTFSLEASGDQVFAPNCDGTVTTSNNSANAILTKNIETSTLLPGAGVAATNTLEDHTNLYVTQEGPNGTGCPANCVAELTSTPPALKQEIPVAPSLVNLTGFGSSTRIYAISQGNSNSTLPQPSWGDCDNPAAVAGLGEMGEADAIETTSNTVSAHLALGACPVYGIMTPDGLRTFIMNRGSGTVTVINSQLNAIDSQHPTIPVGAGPVYADYYRDGQVLVTANFDSNTISIIDASLDIYGNDSATFGTVLATINLANAADCPTGSDTFCMHPVEVTVLQDGSRAYVANQGDIAAGVPGSVSVVNLTNYSIEKTIPLPANYYPHAIGSVYSYPYGKVYVASQNSPYLIVIRTDTDTISATPEMQGNIVDMRVNAQYPDQSSPGAANEQTESRSVGSGAP